MNSITTVLIALLFSLTTVGFAEAQPNASQKKRQLYSLKIGEWNKEREKMFDALDFRSNIDGKSLNKLVVAGKQILVPLGAKSLPYLLVIEQEDQWIGGAFYDIAKFKANKVTLSEESMKLRSSTLEFPELIEKRVTWDAQKIFLAWWLQGRVRTPLWFAERYPRWLNLRTQADTKATQAAYELLRDIGIAALPLWVAKLKDEKDAGVQSDIVKAISFLTDDQVKQGSSPAEVERWWRDNQEQWRVPFPANQSEFIGWLKYEIEPSSTGEARPFAFDSTATLSYIRDEEAITILVGQLDHPSVAVRSLALEQLQKMLDEHLPVEYQLNAGNTKWETTSDLLDLGKYELVERTLREWNEKMRDEATAKKVAVELKEWWKLHRSSRGRAALNIHWERSRFR